VSTYASTLSAGSVRAGDKSTLNLPGSSSPNGTTKERAGGGSGIGDAVEIWDVRRGWIAKWTVRGSAIEGGVTGLSTLNLLNPLFG
jgi:hypothetical protein